MDRCNGPPRLRKPVEFKRVFSRPRVSSDALFKVLARSNELSYSRLGMAVSRKVDRRATVRNRIKRVIRESFRAHQAQHGTGQTLGMDYVVLPRGRAATISNERLFQSLSRHWASLDKNNGMANNHG